MTALGLRPIAVLQLVAGRPSALVLPSGSTRSFAHSLIRASLPASDTYSSTRRSCLSRQLARRGFASPTTPSKPTRAHPPPRTAPSTPHDSSQSRQQERSHARGTGRTSALARAWVFPSVGLAAAASGFYLLSPNETSTRQPTAAASSGTQLDAPSPDSTLTPRPSLLLRYLLNPLNDYLLEPLLTSLRFLHLVGLFLPVLLTTPALYFGSRERLPKGEKGERSGAVWWYGFLVWAMEKAGPSFIKLAQWAGSRTDLFPPSLCNQFGLLHSNGKPHSFAHTKRVVERVFGRKFDDVFESFEKEPIGCGAIAQVYKGVLKPDIVAPEYHSPKMTHISPQIIASMSPPASDGSTNDLADVPTTAVAIKVLHPRVHQTVARDLKIMGFFASLLNVLPGMVWISLPEEVDVFGQMMNQQLDLRIESSNLTKFEDNFTHRRGAGISFPRPVRDFSTRDLLVEEFENGLPLKYFLRNGGGEFDSQLANMGLDAFLKMLLLDNWTHGDLHPGNIMVKFYRPTTGTLLRSAWNYLRHNLSSSSPSSSSPQAATESDDVVARMLSVKHNPEQWLVELRTLFDKGYRPELVFIDAGLVTCLSDTNRRNFLDLFTAIAEFDGYRAGKLMVERCRTPELVIEPETFALKIQHIVLSVKSTTFTLKAIRISDILTEVLKSVQQSHVKMEGDFINTILSILLLEGIGRQLDPELDLFKSALPILRQVGGRMGTKDITGMPGHDLGAMIKIWLYLEGRQLASAAKVDWDEFIRYDWLTPNS